MEADVKLIVNLINAAMFVICLVIMAVGWILQNNIEKSEKTILDALNMMSEGKKIVKRKGKLTIQRVINCPLCGSDDTTEVGLRKALYCRKCGEYSKGCL
jgi:hypothetical protein